MSKRKINKQQLSRIEKQQSSFRQKEIFDDDLLSEGLVIARYSKHAEVEDKSGALIRCNIRPNIDSIVAGDHVIWQPEGNHQGIIVSRHNRKSSLGGPDSNGNIKPVAANITQIIIVIAPVPEVSWNLLDSYLIMADYLQINPFIVLNKTDLPSDEMQKNLLKIYEPLGYPILFTNIDITEDKLLQKAFNNQVNVLVGQSGVGKSSIVAKILPDKAAEIATGDISKHVNLGRHITSRSIFYHLPNGGALIDSPGIREFSLWNISESDIAKGYREFLPYISQCKYRNCSHINTPGCAVINAVKNKIIHNQRYENYVKMLET